MYVCRHVYMMYSDKSDVCTHMYVCMTWICVCMYSHQGSAPFLISPKTGLGNLGVNVTFVPGCKDVACSDDSGFADAIKAAQQAQAIIAVVGLDQGQERSVFQTQRCEVVSTLGRVWFPCGDLHCLEITKKG